MTQETEAKSAKDYLRGVRTLQVGIKGKSLRIQQLRDLVESATIALRDEVVQGGGAEDRLGSVIACICDLQAEVEQDLGRLVMAHQNAQSIINQVRDIRYQTLLDLYYLTGLSLERVAEEMGYSDRHIHRLHSEALRAVAPFIQSCQGMSLEVTPLT